jgi:hypothetical protein
MENFEQILKDNEFIGIVEDNADPDKKQRCRIRIPYIHGDKKDIPTDSLPWSQPFRDPNGLTFMVPDKDKVVNVMFPSGNLYYPVYKNAQHLNVNLQKKVETYSGDAYTSFVALCYNHNTQIFIEKEKGLNIIHKFNGINITKEQIAINLKDNQSTLYLGDDKAAQELMLGTNFMEWFDTLMQTLMNAYIGNNGAPCVANPDLINVFTQYQSKRPSFLSQHIYAIENNKIRTKDFDVEAQIGDKITITNKPKELNAVTAPIDYKPAPKSEEKGLKTMNEYTAPPTDGKPDETSVPPKDKQEDSSDNKKVNKMVKYLKSQKYTVYEDAYHLNIVGIRNAQKDKGIVTNKFDDTCWVFYKDDKGVWQLYDDYKITTTPGFEPKSSVLPNGPNNGGVAMLVYGQFIDKWKIGYHQNRTGKPGGKTKSDGSLAPEHKCLKEATTAHVRNTPSGTGYLLPGAKQPQTGAIGINIHHSNETGVTTNVYNWSEGCQVFASKNQHLEFLELCEQQVSKTSKGRFTYTLIPQKDFDNYQA